MSGQTLLPAYGLPKPTLSQHNSVLTPDRNQDLTNQILLQTLREPAQNTVSSFFP